AKTVRVWEDDPISTGAVPIERPVPKLPTGRMKVTIDGAAPVAQPYDPGTPEFRYWVAAFHESFGDISAILVALQLPSVRQRAIAETEGRYRSSRVSRVAEQMGWAVRQRQPCAVEPDCLRNAVNCFAYAPTDALPMLAPASALSSAPHSFSRVFTAAFFEAFAGMMVTLSRQPTADHLLEASHDAGRLLVAAVRAAPVVPDYYAQVAAQMIVADGVMFEGKYAAALEYGFLSRSVLSPASVTRGARPALAVAAMTPGPGARAAPRRSELPMITLPGHDFGLGSRPVIVSAAGEPGRLAVASNGLDGSPSTPLSAEMAARAFLSELVMRDRVDIPGRPADDLGAPRSRMRTHEVVEEGEALVVVRRLFEAPGTLACCGRSRRTG
ncbi:MAG: hypothetical protein LC733_12190, partial [Actinobacteria bacterium]|nr:hypothetical protein [Actinomycetota bacterium]